MVKSIQKQKILTSCYSCDSATGENFIADHAFAYQVSGSLKIYDGKQTYLFNEGSFRLNVRNKLVKFVKQAPKDGEYKSIVVNFDQQFLKEFSKEKGITPAKKHSENPPVLALKNNPEFIKYIQSLLPYLPFTDSAGPELVQLKIKEALLTILGAQPELADILFDFAEPEKIDLKSYMEKNFQFNLKIPRFAYLTGRSLSAFKRDFKAIYNTTPGKWLMEKRLDQAYFLLKEKGLKPSIVFLEVGFEDFSHFSFVFKKKFGVSPSKLHTSKKVITV